MAYTEGTFSCPYCFSTQYKEAYVKDGVRRWRCVSCGCPVGEASVQATDVFRRPKVLFVDDDPLLLAMLKPAMVERGFEVITAADGPSGIETARTEQPELVVADVFMPHMSGFELCRRLRSEPNFDRTPIIVMSARPDPALEEKGRAAGATLAVPKPADLDQLAETLRRVLADPA